jgi:ribose transport system permease protein
MGHAAAVQLPGVQSARTFTPTRCPRKACARPRALGAVGDDVSLPHGLRPGQFSAIWFATGILFLLSWATTPQSVSHGSILGMLPFAAVLAIAAVGQTLVIQQGGIDLSVPGTISITVIVLTRIPNGDSGKLAWAMLIAYAIALGAGLVNGVMVTRIGITPIVATLGMNALLYGGVLEISHGTPRDTTEALYSFANNSLAGVPTTVWLAIGVTAVVGFVVKRTVVGRRFEAVGASAAAARASGLGVTRYRLGAYVAASLLYCSAGVLLAGVVKTPSAFQGDSYLLPSVAAVVLGGTSLLGGVGSVVASAMGALFLSQLEQLVLTTGVSTAVQYIIEAAAIAAGVAVYQIRWSRVWEPIGSLRSSRAGESPVGPHEERGSVETRMEA